MSSMVNESDLVKLTKEGVGLISAGFGIDLTWQETLALKNYFRSFSEVKKTKNPNVGIKADALHLFMIDYFGLDSIELGGGVTQISLEGIVRLVNYGLGLLNGTYWTGDERFREYCRRNVSMWRDRRDAL